jgi:hypothetical protein
MGQVGVSAELPSPTVTEASRPATEELIVPDPASVAAEFTVGPR